MSKFFFIFYLFFFYFTASFSEPYKPDSVEDKNLKEILLEPFQVSEIASDGPVSNLFFSGDTLFILTKKNIWTWKIKEKSLQKIHVMDDEGGGLFLLGGTSSYIYVASSNFLYALKFEPLKIKKTIFSLGSSLSFSVKGDDAYLIRDSEIYALKGEEVKLVSSYRAKAFESAPLYVKEVESLFSFNKKDVFQFSLKKNFSKEESIFKSPFEIKGLLNINNSLFVLSKNSVTRLGYDRSVIKTYPVQGMKTLASSYLTESFHAYLFSDRTLEVHNVLEKKSNLYRVPIVEAQKISGMFLTETYLALILDGSLNLFQREKEENPKT